MKNSIFKKLTALGCTFAVALTILSGVALPAFASLDTTEPSPAPVTETSPTPVVTTTPEVSPTPKATPVPDVTAKAYIANYQVVDINGNALASVKPGDKVIVAVTVIDERINADEFGGIPNSQTNRISPIMTQGSFTIPGSNNITAKIKESVIINGADGSYPALCYVLEFREVTYQGGTNEFGFSISYTDAASKPSNTSNNAALPYPHTALSLNITQATDDVPVPNVILNSANYGNVATIGQNFTLKTIATNTSSSLQLDNVSVKIELPAGLTLASGNSQVLIGSVNPNGTINHDFVLMAQGVANDITTLPVKLTYSFEAFVAGKRTAYTSVQDLSINVQQPTRFSFSGLDFSQEVYTGQSGYLTAKLVNKGKTTVYNVTAEITTEDLDGAQVVFVGNVAPGSTADADFDFYPKMAGSASGKVVVTYEDASGKQETIESEFTLNVIEQEPFIPGEGDIGTIAPVVPEKKNTGLIVGGIVVLAGAGAGGFVFWKKKKAKKLQELEDEDEDI